MSTYTPTKLFDGALGTASVPLFQATSTTILKEIILTNTTTGALTVSVSAAGNVLIPGTAVGANSLTVIDLSKVMVTNDALTGDASAAGVNAFISGIVIT